MAWPGLPAKKTASCQAVSRGRFCFRVETQEAHGFHEVAGRVGEVTQRSSGLEASRGLAARLHGGG